MFIPCQPITTTPYYKYIRPAQTEMTNSILLILHVFASLGLCAKSEFAFTRLADSSWCASTTSSFQTHTPVIRATPFAVLSTGAAAVRASTGALIAATWFRTVIRLAHKIFTAVQPSAFLLGANILPVIQIAVHASGTSNFRACPGAIIVRGHTTESLAWYHYCQQQQLGDNMRVAHGFWVVPTRSETRLNLLPLWGTSHDRTLKLIDIQVTIAKS